MSSRRTIKTSYLTRVEGEGSLYVRTRGDRVTEVRLSIFEPPRFFEAFLQGRRYDEAPDITARTCGICPVAYQMSAVHAMESAFGVRVEGQLRALRRLLYCGEWIESHALHAFMLHAPDFLGYDDAVALAKDHPDIVQTALRIKKVGNRLMSVLGGREIHPINVRMGGFYRVPGRRELQELVDELQWARDASLHALWWASSLPFPDFQRDYVFVALRHPEEYPFNEGNIVSSTGLSVPASRYEEHFREEHVPYTHALHSTLDGVGGYLVGPLARFNVNYDLLPGGIQDASREAGLDPPVLNPFKSIAVRCVEILYACEEALRIIEAYELPERSFVEMAPREAAGYGCTEAPRGILYHRYDLDAQGVIRQAKIVPPTSQNQASMEEDLRRYVADRLSLSKAELTRGCESVVRNYDPCISCATHFLTLELDREGG